MEGKHLRHKKRKWTNTMRLEREKQVFRNDCKGSWKEEEMSLCLVMERLKNFAREFGLYS